MPADQLMWWLQLRESTVLGHADSIRDKIESWLGDAGDGLINWAADVPIPTAISIYGYDPPPPFHTGLEEIQPLLGDYEYMIFTAVVNQDVCDRVGVQYLVVTRRIIASASGDELYERVKQLVLRSEEELLESQNSS